MNLAQLDFSALDRPAAWLLIVGAYLLGSVPFGLIVAKCVKGIDLRTFGSGNIGATNAGRALGRGWGFTVFALDFVKGFVPVFVARFVFAPDGTDLRLVQVLAGTAATLGHCFPIYLRFRGGKGVATGTGALVAINAWLFIAGGVVWLLTRLTTGYAGLASIAMGIAFPIAAWVMDLESIVVVGAALLTLLILVRHRSNIQRMLEGTEPNARRKREEAREARHHG